MKLLFGKVEMGPGEPDFQFIRKFAEKNGSLKRGKLGFHLKFSVSCKSF